MHSPSIDSIPASEHYVDRNMIACQRRKELPDGSWQCEDCGQIAAKNHYQPCGIQSPAAPDHGPGTEFAALLASIGLLPKVGCQCQAIKTDMNSAGVEGSVARRDEFIRRLQENYAAHYSWLDLFAAARKSKKLEAARLLKKLRTLNPNRAIERLFDEAIRRSREKASG